MFGQKAVRVEAQVTPGLPMYANCPECHTQNVVKWGHSTSCCNCGTKMTVGKATLCETQFTRTSHAGFSSPSVTETR